MSIITVLETPPKIYPDTLKKYKTMKGNDIDIIVKFTATPTPVDEWTVNGHILKKSKRIISSIDECSAILTIRDMQEKDLGDYNLKLTNPHGEDNIEINVIVMRKYLHICILRIYISISKQFSLLFKKDKKEV